MYENIKKFKSELVRANSSFEVYEILDMIEQLGKVRLSNVY